MSSLGQRRWGDRRAAPRRRFADADVYAIRKALRDPVRLAVALDLRAGPGRCDRATLLVGCPWHEDREPSCSLSPGPDGTLRVKCFGCGATGDALTLIARVHRLDLRRDFEAVLVEASRIAHVSIPAEKSSSPSTLTRYFGEPLSNDHFAAILAPLQHLGRLDESEVGGAVTRYLDSRGVVEEARADGWTALGPRRALREWVRMMVDGAEPASGCSSPFTRHDLAMSGLFATRAGRPVDIRHPDHRVVIPWRAPDGEVYTVQRRRLTPEAPDKYVSTPRRAMLWPYGIERLADASSEAAVVFVEGAVDVLALRILYRRAERNWIALGLPGVSGWRAEWAAFAKGRAAIIAFDADRAGDAAVAHVADDLYARGAAQVRRAVPHGAKDWAQVLVA